MTEAELAILLQLGAAFDSFNKLEQIHPADLGEFASAIHICQNIILSREGLRWMKAKQSQLALEKGLI